MNCTQDSPGQYTIETCDCNLGKQRSCWGSVRLHHFRKRKIRGASQVVTAHEQVASFSIGFELGFKQIDITYLPRKHLFVIQKRGKLMFKTTSEIIFHLIASLHAMSVFSDRESRFLICQSINFSLFQQETNNDINLLTSSKGTRND